MPNISVSGDGKDTFSPNDKVEFVLQSNILGEMRSPFIRFRVPKFPRRIDFVGVQCKATPDIQERYDTTAYYIKSYKCELDFSNNTRHILQLNFTTLPTTIAVKDKIKITSTSGALSTLNNLERNVILKNTRYVKIFVPKTFPVGTGTVTPANNYINEQIQVVDGKRYRINVPNDYIKSFTYNDVVRDILIFTFRQSSTALTPGMVKKSMHNSEDIDESTPPTYTTALRDAYAKKQAYSRFLANRNGGFIDFYVAVARYTYNYNTSSWEGEWLHKRPDGKTYWSVAVRPS